MAIPAASSQPGEGRVDGFEIVEVTRSGPEEDIEQLATVAVESLRNQPMFLLRTPGLSAEERFQWTKKYWIQATLERSDFRTFGVRDLSTGKLIAYTGLQIPAEHLSEADAAVGVELQQQLMASLPPAGREFMKSFEQATGGGARDDGYDPKLHFHKRNTLCLPSYQRRGLGGWLTDFCNAIADDAGRPTYVRAVSTMWPTLEHRGFEILKIMHVDARKFGGPSDVEVHAFKRPAKSA